MFTEQQLQQLERRLVAASADALLWGGGWYALVRTAAVPAEERNLLIALPAATILLAVAAGELLTGLTPGKWLTGLRVRSPEGAAPTQPRLLLRGVLRLLPLAILLTALPAASAIAYLAAFLFAGTVTLSYLSAAYLSFIRHNLSPFDLAAGTVVARRAESPS